MGPKVGSVRRHRILVAEVSGQFLSRSGPRVQIHLPRCLTVSTFAPGLNCALPGPLGVACAVQRGSFFP